MNKILLITHGALGQVFIEVASQMLGQQANAEVISFSGNVEQFNELLQNQIKNLAENDHLLILSDLFGGTPSNLSIPLLAKGRVEVITGLNLGILLHLLTQPASKPFAELCHGAKKAGLESILLAGEFL